MMVSNVIAPRKDLFLRQSRRRASFIPTIAIVNKGKQNARKLTRTLAWGKREQND